MPSLSLPSKDPGLRARLAPHPRPPRLWGLAPQCPGGSSKQLLRKREASILFSLGCKPPTQSTRTVPQSQEGTHPDTGRAHSLPLG